MIVACVESTRGPPCVELVFDFRTDRDVEAREPDLRADEVDVQRVGQRVDEAADEEERRELGEETVLVSAAVSRQGGLGWF